MENVAETTPFMDSFVVYHKTVLKMTSDLRQLRDFSTELQLEPALIQAIDEVLQRVEASRFTIAVVGEFRRGKSTFINALLGKEILPSDVVPTTATLNRVTYGLRPTACILYKDGHEEEVGVDQLSAYVTQEALDVAANVREAVVYYPLEILRNNVDIYDTPGLNDDATMTDVTLSILPSIDAAILVIMADSPFGMYEQDFLNKLLANDLGRVIFIVTAIDRMRTPEERERITQHIAGRISRSITKRAEALFGKDTDECNLYLKRIGPPKVFPLSGYQALQARRTHDEALLQESRFPQFLEALEQFLTRDRGVIVLQVMVERAVKGSMKVLETVAMRRGALHMQQEDFKQVYESSVAEIKTLRARQKEELQKIDAAVTLTREKVRPLFEQLESELKRAADQAIDSATILPSDLNKANRDAFMQKMARRVSDAVQNSARQLAERIQLDIQRELVSEANRLQAFSTSVEEVLYNIEMQFVNIQAGDEPKRNSAAEGMAAALAVYTGFGGIWSGYRQAGAKGAVVGGVASIGTAFGTGIIVALLGLPVTWPVVLVAGVASIFTGGWLTKALFGGDLVENFKKNYRQEVHKEIETQLRTRHVDQTVEQQIGASFDALKQRVKQEVDAALDQTQRNLDDLNRRRERSEALTENDLTKLEKIAAETQRILENAYRLNDQLVEILSV